MLRFRFLFLILIFFFVFLLPLPQTFAAADGVFISSTTLGSTVRLIGNIPSNPCKAHGLGDDKVSQQVDGFMIQAFYLDENKIIIGNNVIADLSDAKITEFSISGRPIGFHEWDSGATNASDWLKTDREYVFDPPITYNSIDTARVIVENVKLINEGHLELNFALMRDHGVGCTGTMSLYNIGKSSSPAKNSSYDYLYPTQKPTSAPVLQSKTKITPSVIVTVQSVPTVKQTKPVQKSKKIEKSFFESLISNLLKTLHIGK